MVHVTFAGVPIPRSPYTVTVGQGRPAPAAFHRAHLQPGGLGWGQPGTCCCSPALAPGTSVLPLLGPPPPPPLAFSLSLSLHAFTFGRARSSCLETCCSLLCPQGQRYLDLSSSGVGGGWAGCGGCGGSWCGWSTGKACHPGLGPRSLGHGPFQFFLTRPSPSRAAHRPSLVGDKGGDHPALVSSSSTSPLLTACNPGACRAVGRGLQPKGVRVKETADFKVYTKGAGSGELKVTVKGPSKLACGWGRAIPAPGHCSAGLRPPLVSDRGRRACEAEGPG